MLHFKKGLRRRRHRHKNLKKGKFPTFSLPFPSPKLHQDAKKMQKKCNLWPKFKMKKMKKMQVTFSPPLLIVIIHSMHQ